MTFLFGADLRPTISKDPDAVLRYGINTAPLLATGDTIASVSVSGSAGITADLPQADGAVVSARVAGGTAGETASMTLRWVTTGGETDERTLYFNVAQR